MRSRGLTQAEIAELCRRAGVEPPKAPPKYGNKYTYYDGRMLHTVGTDCVPGFRCPICDNPAIKADRSRWFQSRDEALFVAKCDLDLKLGHIRAHARSPIIVLSPGERSERVTYRPDRDVWVTSDPAGAPDRRYEVKGARGMISQQGLMRIKLYRAAVARGEQPPLFVVNKDGEEIDLGQHRRRSAILRRNWMTVRQ
jgi:hypothetical protein